MPTNIISTYLTYANLQMAAEAIYPIGFVSGSISSATLTNGNNRSSKFPITLANQFSKDWEVVDHRANTSTGFSGTLFRCKTTDPTRGLTKGELVTPFRSNSFKSPRNTAFSSKENV